MSSTYICEILLLLLLLARDTSSASTHETNDWLYRFDLESDEWTVLSKTQAYSPPSRLNAVMMVEGSRLFVYGGIASGIIFKTFADLYSFDLDKLVWTRWFARDDSVTGSSLIALGISSALGRVFTLSSSYSISARDLPKERQPSRSLVLDLALSTDWDTLSISSCQDVSTCRSIRTSVSLCSQPWMPCYLSIKGSAAAAPPASLRRAAAGQTPTRSIEMLGNARIECDASRGCSGIELEGVDLVCKGLRDAPEAPLRVLGLGAHLNLVDASVSACHTSDDGGSIQVYGGSSAYLLRVRIVGSTSSGSGGGMVLQGSSMIVYESSFEGCKASQGGGAIHLRSQALEYFPTVLSKPVAFIQSSQFLSNSASQGGALSAEASSSLLMKGCLLQENRASQDGGALYLDKTAARLDGNSLVGNAAGGGGGGVLWDGVQPVLVSDSEEEDAVILCSPTGKGHTASYGPCVASTFHELLLVMEGKEIASGIPFTVRVTKLDFYRQTITTDSSSSLQIRTVKPSAKSGTAVLMESAVLSLKEGAASTSATVKMLFTKAGKEEAFPAKVEGLVGLEAYGVDVSSGKEIKSNVLEAQPRRSVCPVGHVIKTDASASLASPSATDAPPTPTR